MTSYYSLVQFTADPLADERVNLGLILLGDDDGIPAVHLAHGDLVRAAQLMGPDINAGDLEDLLTGVQEDLDPLSGDVDAVDLLRSLATRRERSLTITAPRASTLSLGELHERVAARALPVRPTVSRARDRRSAVALARRGLVRAVQLSNVHVAVKSNVAVQGQRQPHHVELGLVNGSVRHGVSGLSLEGPQGVARAREIDALKWLVDDVKAQDEAFPMSIVLLTQEAEPMSQELTVLRGLGAEFVQESALDDWAIRAVSGLAAT